MAKQGYGDGTVPEAARLAASCDHILTKMDGLSFSVIGIVDGESSPAHRFELPAAEVMAIGKTCREKYAGTISGTRMPAQIEIIEVRPAVSAEDRQRLQSLASNVGVFLRAYAVDLSSSTVTQSRWSLFNVRLRLLRRALVAPRMGEEELRPEAPAALPAMASRPIVTYLIIAVLAAVFVMEIALQLDPSGGLFAQSVRTLAALGGVSRALVSGGDWYRIVSAAFLHADLVHLAANAVALWMAGVVLEPLIGRVWLCALFFVGAAGGSLLSIAVNPPDVVSVGASGAIMGLLAAAYVSSFRLPSGMARTQAQTGILRVLIPSLFPYTTHSSGHIDFGAHAGGTLVGLLFGALLLRTWPRQQAQAPMASLAKGLAVLSVAVLGWSGYQAIAGYERWNVARFLIPRETFPKSDEEAVSRAEELRKTYPRDPRSHFFLAVTLLDTNEIERAEAELKLALADPAVLSAFERKFEIRIRSVLAEVLLAENKKEEANKELDVVCSPALKDDDSAEKRALCARR